MVEKGFKHSKESKEKIRQSKLGKKNPNWKSDDVGYGGLHGFIRRRLPKPEKCPKCNKKGKMEIANITGVYDRNLDNWRYLCRKCHFDFDRTRGQYEKFVNLSDENREKLRVRMTKNNPMNSEVSRKRVSEAKKKHVWQEMLELCEKK